MNTDLRQLLEQYASSKDIAIQPGFYRRLDEYGTRLLTSGRATLLQRKYSSGVVRLVVERTLALHALRIALIEGKRSADADDVKAAIWFFHKPEDPDDTCLEAADTIIEMAADPNLSLLLEEKVNASFRRGSSGSATI